MKKTMIGMMLGGAAMFGYMKYMDGSIQRGIKNMKLGIEGDSPDSISQCRFINTDIS